jgi:hypothetical protein
MEKRNQLDAFEEFLLDEVNEHKMYPSGRVWNNIRTEVQGKRSWPALTIIALTVLSALTISTFIGTQKKPTLTFTPSISKPLAIRSNQEKPFTTYHSSAQIIASKIVATKPESQLTKPVTLKQFEQAAITTNSVALENSANDLSIVDASNSISDITSEITSNNIETANPISTNEALNKSSDISLLPAIIQQQVNSDISNITATISPQKKKKYSIQFYATPSASFRALSDQKVKELVQPSLIAIPLASPSVQTPTFNQAVRHKPAVGLELGFVLSYQLSNRLQFKTGLQLNIRQYQIETYESAANAATLSLLSGSRVQTVSVMSSYNNSAGFRTAQLDNKVYQMALPIGLDYQLLRFKKFGIHTQASIQPTYNINKNVYLLSTDYANYAAGNDYVRKWNINTSVGLQFSYQKGNTVWQLGPQIRYQTLPTYTNPYPIKENLIDYGFRIGWSKQFK